MDLGRGDRLGVFHGGLGECLVVHWAFPKGIIIALLSVERRGQKKR
jgi:hypothetical protein